MVQDTIEEDTVKHVVVVDVDVDVTFLGEGRDDL